MQVGREPFFIPATSSGSMTELPDMVALDVVILPPGPIMDMAIGANRILLAGNPGGGIRLEKDISLPHISVAIFPARREDIPEIARRIDRITRRCSPMALTIDAIAKRRVGTETMVSVFHIPRPDVLQLFHKAVMNAMMPYMSSPTGPEIFAGEASQASLDCLLQFPKSSAYARYSPHITLGSGDLPELVPGIDLPVRFEATRVAICHLGNHCTCQKILAQFDLGANRRP